MKVRVKLEARNALFKANVPTFVIDGILGKEVESDESLNVNFDWLGQHTTWSIPAECVEIVTTE